MPGDRRPRATLDACARRTRIEPTQTTSWGFFSWSTVWAVMRRARRPRKQRWKPFARLMLEPGGDPRHQIRRAITAANNRIFEAASENETWRGMACVLTLAVISDDKVMVGHVGDSRLYLTWNGAIRKLTSDHSPVGEREDAGELTEAEAMAHPRRHEVFRDVGSRRREPDEEDFIEVKEFLFKPDAAILLCSDGLSDQLTSTEMLEVIERYDGDPAQVARRTGGGRQHSRRKRQHNRYLRGRQRIPGQCVAGGGGGSDAKFDHQSARYRGGSSSPAEALSLRWRAR